MHYAKLANENQSAAGEALDAFKIVLRDIYASPL